MKRERVARSKFQMRVHTYARYAHRTAIVLSKRAVSVRRNLRPQRKPLRRNQRFTENPPSRARAFPRSVNKRVIRKIMERASL